MDRLRKFTEVDNHEAVKVGELGRDIKPVKVVKPKFTTDFPGVVIWEGTDELTLRAHEERARRSFIDISKVEEQRWDSPLIDVDWHVFCQTIYEGMKEKSGRSCIITFRTCIRSWRPRNLEKNKKTRALWTMKEVNDRRKEYYDPNHQKDIQEKTHIRLRLWYVHLKNPMTTREKTLEYLEQNEGESATTSEWWLWSFGSLVLIRIFSGINFQGNCNDDKFGKDLDDKGNYPSFSLGMIWGTIYACTWETLRRCRIAVFMTNTRIRSEKRNDKMTSYWTSLSAWRELLIKIEKILIINFVFVFELFEIQFQRKY